jgi:hypothetical protein
MRSNTPRPVSTSVMLYIALLPIYEKPSQLETSRWLDEHIINTPGLNAVAASVIQSGSIVRRARTQREELPVKKKGDGIVPSKPEMRVPGDHQRDIVIVEHVSEG